jgi:HlyD family secretion protein
MRRNYIYVILGFTVFCAFLILIFFIQKPSKEEAAEIQVGHPPFPTYISGVGIVEPESGNINISSFFNRIVEKVDVSANEKVEKGDVLFELYHNDLLAQLRIKQQEYEKALTNLHKLQALPRDEDLTISKEVLNKAQSVLNESKAQYDMVSNLSNPHAISKEEQDKRLYGYQQAEAELKKAQSEYLKVKSGAWPPELKIAQHEVDQVKADVDAIELEIQRTYIKSPLNGTVLKINIHEGETLDPNKTAIILGNIDELYLRVSIDQFNLMRFNPNSPAVAFRQGDHSNGFPLKFIHVDPIMVPKKYLTNDVNEKVDTHVFEIVYSIEKKDAPLIIGEQMDVYIDAEKK